MINIKVMIVWFVILKHIDLRFLLLSYNFESRRSNMYAVVDTLVGIR